MKTRGLIAEEVHYTIAEGNKSLLRSVHVQIQPGELIGLIGPNGAGKSTLMKILLGFLQPTDGVVSLDSHPLVKLSAKQRAQSIAYMGQQGPGAFPFTAVEIVEMGTYPVLGTGKQPGKTERAAAMDALNYVGMGDFAQRNFLTLSGGEKQLVLFARVLVQNTPYILLDEPTANLDLGHETQLLQMSRELCKEGKGIMIAMHNLNSAAEFCDRLILLDRGELVAQGTPREVLTQKRVEQYYHTHARVGINESTGSITVTPVPQIQTQQGFKVHIIGGAGSSVTLTRLFHLQGIPMTGGVAHELDSDAKLWKALGIPYLEVPAFSEITEDVYGKAKNFVDEADLVILCSFPFGRGNVGNLELASYAALGNKLIILSTHTGTCERGFYLPHIDNLYRKIEQENPPLDLEQALEQVRNKISVKLN